MKYPVNLGLQEGFELFVDDCWMLNRSKKTIEDYEENMDRFMKFLQNEKQIEELLMSDFSAENLKDYHRHLRTTSKTQKTVSTKTSMQKPSSRSDQM
jgi:site-specific recombinase XerD